MLVKDLLEQTKESILIERSIKAKQSTTSIGITAPHGRG